MSAPKPLNPVPLDDVAEVRTGTFVRFPDSPFELYQPYPPAGDQPEAIDKLVEGVTDGEVFQTLLGRDWLRQNLHHGQCDCTLGATGHRVCAQQNLGGSAVQ